MSALTKHQAAERLGFPDLADADAICSAFRFAVKAAHPDTRVQGVTGDTMRDLKMARDLLLKALDDENRTCVLCKGSGKVRGRVGATNCIACSGTGEKSLG